MLNLLRFAFSLLISIVCVVGSGLVTAQDFPTKTIRFIVPSAAGLGTDTAARILAPEMAKLLGQSVIVENKPGAGQIVGLQHVAKDAPADGYTIVITTSLGALPVTEKDLRFDPLKDLPPFLGLAEGTSVLVSPIRAPWKSFKEMIAYAKANPGKLNYAEASASTLFRMEVVIRDLGLNIVRVPYKSGGDMIQGIVRDESQMGILAEANVNSVKEHLQVLAATGPKRLAAFPNVPTYTELGYPQIRGSSWYLNVRAGTPKPVIDKLYAAASRALQQPEVKARFDKIQYYVLSDPPEAAAKSILEEAKLYADIAQKIGFKPE